MTTSNHRPYTYPEGKIKVDGNPHTRDAAVCYTDYAIGNFIKKASQKQWFNNTIFVIIADHCASSAGKTSLPADKYHIPCIIYSPKYIVPQVVKNGLFANRYYANFIGFAAYSVQSKLYWTEYICTKLPTTCFYGNLSKSWIFGK